MKSYYIHFICHGNIDETHKGKYIGTTNVPLSDKGKMELKKLDHNMKYPGGSALFTGPLKRCKETCEILYPDLKPIVIDQLTECNFGEW
ncbi:MAG: histidine phosphatase family protein, partial [Ruminococcus sp.]